MKDLRQITVIGLGLLGGSITLAVKRSLSAVKTVGYSHRAETRQKAMELGVVDSVSESLSQSVVNADLVILATPICTFEDIFGEIAESLCDGCIVTDVGSTKSLVHKWAAKKLGKNVRYIGSHPIAGSEKRGVEFARDDLFDRAACILTTGKRSDSRAVETLREFWSLLGCVVHEMTPAEHDRTFGDVSHLPHVTAASLVNASNSKTLRFAGRGFIDTSRIASGPANIWADILTTNAANVSRGIDRLKAELDKIQAAIDSGDKKRIERLLAKARETRAELIDYKIKKKELV